VVTQILMTIPHFSLIAGPVEVRSRGGALKCAKETLRFSPYRRWVVNLLDVPADRDKRWFYAEKAPGQGQGVIGQRSIHEGSCQPRLLLRCTRQAISVRIRPEQPRRGVPKRAYPFGSTECRERFSRAKRAGSARYLGRRGRWGISEVVGSQYETACSCSPSAHHPVCAWAC